MCQIKLLSFLVRLFWNDWCKNASFDWISLRFHLVVVTVLVTELDFFFVFGLWNFSINRTNSFSLEFPFCLLWKMFYLMQKLQKHIVVIGQIRIFWIVARKCKCLKKSLLKILRDGSLLVSSDRYYRFVSFGSQFLHLGRRLALQPSVSSSKISEFAPPISSSLALKNRPTISYPQKFRKNQSDWTINNALQPPYSHYTPLTEQSFRSQARFAIYLVLCYQHTYRNTPTLTLIHK